MDGTSNCWMEAGMQMFGKARGAKERGERADENLSERQGGGKTMHKPRLQLPGAGSTTSLDFTYKNAKSQMK